ncbi:type II secretion system F family protein [Microbacterium sp.]|uniref:type II secretion system F family protein n=1 Tax=Microbacterium sp. TaxID=51671 RepID=UPI0039E4AA8F
MRGSHRRALARRRPRTAAAHGTGEAPGTSDGASSAGSSTASVAAQVHRLAVLLQAGVAPARAWEHVGDQGIGPGSAQETWSRRDTSAAGIAEVMDRRGGAWRDVAVAWRVATTVGAPLSDSLRGTAEALRDADQARDDVAVALAEPATTARVISWLPLLGVVLVVAFGFDLAATVTQPVGIGCVVAGAVLMIAARRWSTLLVRRAQPAPGAPGWECDLLAIALSGGVSIDRALEVCETSGCTTVRERATSVLDLSRASGAPAAELLRAEAGDQRRLARTEGRLQAARLGARLLLPLGVCTLPAFLLLGVGPMMLSVLSSAPVVF